MLTKSIMLDENYAEAYLLRANVLLGMGDANSADSDAQWLLGHCADNVSVLMLKARIEMARGNSKDAIDYYTKVIELNPLSAEAYKGRGGVRFYEGDTVGAEEDVRKAMEIEPDDLSDVNGYYSAEGMEHRVRQSYGAANPFVV